MRISGMTGLFFAAMALPLSAQPQENFGHFEQKSLGYWALVDGVSSFVTSTPVMYIDPNGLEWPVPAEWPSDGASIPGIFWLAIGHPFGDIYVDAAIVHDFYCERHYRTDEATHQMFYYASRSLGVAKWKADLMYWAVSTFNSWDLTTEAALIEDCATVNDHEICQWEWSGASADVAVGSIDFSDPNIQAAALAKFAAVARTLKTTGGAVLDVSSDGTVAATLAEIQASADYYRDLFATGEVVTAPEKLGLLSTLRLGAEADVVAAWPEGVPNLAAVPEWQPQDFQATIDSGFVLDRENLTLFTPDRLGVEDQLFDLDGILLNREDVSRTPLSDLFTSLSDDTKLYFGSEAVDPRSIVVQGGSVTASNAPNIVFNAPTAQQRLLLEGLQQYQIESGVQLQSPQM